MKQRELSYPGLHVKLMAVTAIILFHGVTSGSVVLGCDNEQGVDLSILWAEAVADFLEHSDLLRAIHGLCHALPIDVYFRHVYGHQDKTVPFASLDRLSQLNVRCSFLWSQFHITELLR